MNSFLRLRNVAYKTITVAIAFAFFTSFSQAQITSVADGDFNSTSTWDCACIPGLGDDVIVEHTVESNSNNTVQSITVTADDTLLVNSGLNKTTGSLTIEANGYLANTTLLDVGGDYTNAGEHFLGFKTVLSGADIEIDGLGVLSGAKDFELSGGIKNVVTGGGLNKLSGRIYLTNGAELRNSGTVSTRQMDGTSGAEVINETNGFLNLLGTFNTANGMTLEANSFNNTVAFAREGMVNQNLVNPINGRFFNLVIEGDNENTIKRLTGDIEVLGDLTIDTITFDAGDPVAYNILLKGDWNNNAGHFEPRNRTVTLNGSNQTIADHDTTKFNNLVINATSTTTFEAPLEIEGNLNIEGSLNADSNINPALLLHRKLTSSGSLDMAEGTTYFTGTTLQLISGSLDFYDALITNSAGVEISSGNTQIENLLYVFQGNLETNGNLTLLSDANGTASVGPLLAGSISGDVTVQRYHSLPVNGWVHLCSPVSGQTIADWDDDLLTTGFTGSDYPAYFFNNIRLYDETQPGFEDNGLINVSNVTDPIVDGQGYQFYLAAGVMNVSVTGPLLTGSTNLPVSYTDSGSPQDDGWNLVANPYASTVDWNSGAWTKTNVNDAIYVWDATIGQYTSYINGVGSNGGSRYVPSSQSFWVQTNAASPNLVINEPAKSTVDGDFKDGGDDDVPVFRMKITGNGYQDETVMRVHQDATWNFDSQFDAYKLSGADGAPNISTTAADGFDLSINTIPEFNGEHTIPVKMLVGEAGSYSVEMIDPENLGDGICAVLEDQFTGEQYPLANGETHSFELSDTTETARFTLKLNRVASLESIAVTCGGNSDGALNLTSSGESVNYSLFNDMDQLIETGSGADVSFEGLSGGIYYVDVQDENSQCGTQSFTAEVMEPAPLEIDYSITDPVCENDVNGELSVEVLGGSQPYSFAVNGDANASLSGLAPGEYTITVEDANGCSLDADIELTAEVSVTADFNAPPEVPLENGEAQVTFDNYSINGESYFWEFGDGETSTEENPVHSYTEAGNYEVMLTATQGPCDNTSSQWVAVSSVSGWQEQSNLGNYNLYGTPGGIIFEFDLDQSTDITYSLFDITGKLIDSKEVNNIQVGRETFPSPGSSGIYLVEIRADNQIMTVQRVAVK